MTSKSPAITRIREILEEFSFTSGTCKVPVELCQIYYKRPSDSTANFLNTSNASQEQISSLISVCDTAPFGRDSETVLDESYRKALKLDLSQFSTPFDLASTTILHRIQQDLVDIDDGLRRKVYAEPYKLNVYNEGAFFKPHKDTPRAPNMFGSLVVVFPTAHQGGELLLTEGELSWTFDSSRALSNSTPDEPEVAFVAFYSDVTHEVLPVVSGARITLTYNLYFEASDSAPRLPLINPLVTEKFTSLKDALTELMAEERFKKETTVFCFGLDHSYPIARKATRQWQNEMKNRKVPGTYLVEELSQFLKGSDALLFHACKEVGLVPTLNVFYKVTNDGFYHPHMVRKTYLGSDFFTPPVEEVEGSLGSALESDGMKEVKDLVWVTPRSQLNGLDTSYITYGNQAVLDTIYGVICLAASRA